MSETVKLKASDGHELDAYVAKPSGAPVAGLVVVQEIFGVNSHIRSVADRFAKDGFFVVAPAVFDRLEKNVQLGYEGEDMQKAFDFMKRVDVDGTLLDVDAALDYARKQTGKPVGVVGFCFGGSMTWLSASRLKPAAAVAYYGGNIAKFAGERPKAPIMLHFGKKDAHIPESDVAEIQQAHPDVPIYLYDAGHGFNCDARGSYDEPSARLAYQRTLDFLKKHLVQPAK